MSHGRYFSLLCGLLGVKALAMIFVILYAGIGLGPDEAQYWTWSRLLDFGYYSKPPGIAWEIWVGSALFGNTELGVRSMAVAVGFVLALLVYAAAKGCRLSPAACFWSGAAMAFTPMGVMGSFLAITDGGMMLFWTAACAYLVSKIQQAETPSYAIVGVLILGGALFKWPIYSLWIFVLAAWFYYPCLRSWRLIPGLLLSLAALLPSIYWNATHEWATFRHVLSTVAGGHGKAKAGAWLTGNVLEFIGAQVALVSPIVFGILLLALWKMFKKRLRVAPGVVFCGFLTVAILALACVLSIFMKLQGNWAIFAYPTGLVVVGWYVGEGLAVRRQWLVAGLGLSVVLCAFIFSLPAVQSGSIFSRLPIPYRVNPFRHNVGWKALAEPLQQMGYDPAKDFLCGDKYQMASILSFYGPGQKRAYFFNLHGVRKNQFSFWPTPAHQQLGRRAFFVVVENMPQLKLAVPEMADKYLQELQPYFQSVHFRGVFPLFSAYGEVVKGALIFEGAAYNGLMPEDPELY